MHANIAIGALVCDWMHYTPNQICASDSNCVSQGNRTNTNGSEFRYCSAQLVLIPGIAVRIAERHRDINNDAEASLVALCFDCFQNFEGFRERLVLVFTQ